MLMIDDNITSVKAAVISLVVMSTDDTCIGTVSLGVDRLAIYTYRCAFLLNVVQATFEDVLTRQVYEISIRLFSGPACCLGGTGAWGY